MRTLPAEVWKNGVVAPPGLRNNAWARSGRGAAAQPAAPLEEDDQQHDRDQLGADAEEEEVTEADLQMSDGPGEVLPEEPGQEAQARGAAPPSTPRPGASPRVLPWRPATA